MNHPVTPTPPVKRRVVHPTAAKVRRATKAATSDDGSVDSLLFIAALMDPEGRYQPTPAMIARTKRAKR